MVVTTTVEFDNNPLGTFFGGQVVTGKVTLSVDKPKQVRGVALHIKGYADTAWTEHRRRHGHGHGHQHSHRKAIHFHGHEDYISSVTYLMGSAENESIVIEPGIHTFTFAAHLPANCPSSFESEFGHIRYKVSVVLDRPWKFNQSYTKGFTVLKMLDLNYESPMLRVPAQCEVVKTFCCWPCRSKPLRIFGSIPMSAFVPGQVIPVYVVVENGSRTPVQGIKVRLSMVTRFFSFYPVQHSKLTLITISKQMGEGVPKNMNKEFQYAIPVPPTPPTCFNLCRIVQISYQIEVEAKISGFHANQALSLPITIGNVPLTNVGGVQQPTGSGGHINQAFEGPSAAGEPVMVAMDMKGATVQNGGIAEPKAPQIDRNSMFNDPNIPPPSYEQATYMTHSQIADEEKNDYGEKDFTPRYPVFSIPSPTAPLSSPAAEEAPRQADNNGTWL